MKSTVLLRKSKNGNARETLQTRHSEMLKTFRGGSKAAPGLKKQIGDLESEKAVLMNSLDGGTRTALPARHSVCPANSTAGGAATQSEPIKSTEVLSEAQVDGARPAPLQQGFASRKPPCWVAVNASAKPAPCEKAPGARAGGSATGTAFVSPSLALLAPQRSNVVRRILDINDSLAACQERLDGLARHADEDAYFIQNGDLIFHYFQNIDDVARQLEDPAEPGGAAGAKTVLDFLKPADKPQSAAKLAMGLNSFIERKQHSNRGKILERYMSNIDPRHTITIEHADDDPCPQCGKELVINPNEGSAECLDCGFAQHVGVDTDKRSYKEASNSDATFCVYKRINHFREILAMARGYSSTPVPQNVIDVIYDEIRKNRITNLRTINHAKVREWLKKHKLSSYYESIGYILSQLHPDCAPPAISKEDEERLCNAFIQIQGPFAESVAAKSVKRRNCISYAFLLAKLSKMLGLDGLITQLPMLKSSDKRRQAELIYADICTKLNWQNCPIQYD
jgi:hypothetical protein